MTQPAQAGNPLIAAVTDLPWPQPEQILSSDGDRLIYGGACLLMGWSVANESSSNPFRFSLYNGGNTKGHRVATAGAAANASTVCPSMWPGVKVDSGLYVTVVTGTFHGAVWIIPMPGGF